MSEAPLETHTHPFFLLQYASERWNREAMASQVEEITEKSCSVVLIWSLFLKRQAWAAHTGDVLWRQRMLVLLAYPAQDCRYESYTCSACYNARWSTFKTIHWINFSGSFFSYAAYMTWLRVCHVARFTNKQMVWARRRPPPCECWLVFVLLPHACARMLLPCHNNLWITH